jgi:mRNA interferase MazF
MSPGDIVLIRFPQADLKAGKLRPTLIIAVAPGSHPDFLLALITSQIYQAVPNFDEIIDSTDSDYPATGLKVKSVVRLARLISVEGSIINARLGAVSPRRLQGMRSRLVKWLKG